VVLALGPRVAQSDEQLVGAQHYLTRI
jgi:hypothetical protein